MANKYYVGGVLLRRPLIVPETATTCTAAALPAMEVMVAMAVRTLSATDKFVRKIARLVDSSKLIGAKPARDAPYSP